MVCVDFLLSQLVQLSGSELVKLFTNHQDQSSSLSSSWEHLSAAADQSEFTQQGLKPPTVDAALWKRFICCIRESLKRRAVRTLDHDEALGPWLVLVDDNMHYSSMRYEYCQLARKCKYISLMNMCVGSGWQENKGLHLLPSSAPYHHHHLTVVNIRFVSFHNSCFYTFNVGVVINWISDVIKWISAQCVNSETDKDTWIGIRLFMRVHLWPSERILICFCY